MTASASAAIEAFNARAAAFARIHAGMPSSRFAANLHTRVEGLQAGEVSFPVRVSSPAASARS